MGGGDGEREEEIGRVGRGRRNGDGDWGLATARWE